MNIFYSLYSYLSLGLHYPFRRFTYDFTQTFPAGTFDLVCAHFFHSPVEFDRTDILKNAANAVLPGGSLLLVDHAAFPPWSKHNHEVGHEFGSV